MIFHGEPLEYLAYAIGITGMLDALEEEVAV